VQRLELHIIRILLNKGIPFLLRFFIVTEIVGFSIRRIIKAKNKKQNGEYRYYPYHYEFSHPFKSPNQEPMMESKQQIQT